MNEDDDEWLTHLEEYPNVALYGYPLAYLGDKGHFQANGPTVLYRPLIRSINEQVGDQEDSRALTAVASQGYNHLSHRVRHRQRTHDAQLGQVTAAVGGAFSNERSTKRKCQTRITQLENGFPHELFDHKIKNSEVDTSFRLENVYRLSLNQMDPDACRGK